MDLVVGRLPERPAGPRGEVVERKGLGFPDSICDAVAEEVSLALCRFYRDPFGIILHHKVDKVLLRGGEARSASSIVNPHWCVTGSDARLRVHLRSTHRR